MLNYYSIPKISFIEILRVISNPECKEVSVIMVFKNVHNVP